MTRKAFFTTGAAIETVSHSWNASVPMNARATCPVIATIGVESIFAAASPVIRFVAPGPEVATHTPGLPGNLA